MELLKKKYKRDEVENLLSSYKIQYESEIKERIDREAELVELNRKLSSELNAYKEKDKFISDTLIVAKKQADDIIKSAERKYELEVERLKDFSRKWRGYFNYISEKYPYYEATNDALKVFNKLNDILSSKNKKKIIDGVDKLFDGKGIALQGKVFDPKEKINDYIVATSDTGFNLDDVLNPGELKLEDLCKELGLIDEK